MRLLSLPLLSFALRLPATLLHAQESPPPAAEAAPATPDPAATTAEPVPAPAPKVEEYDEIVVKGTTLKGHVLNFSEKSITFETIYGTGKLEIAYTDIEQFKTYNSFRFIQRDGEDVRGRVAQLSTRDLVVAETTGEVKLIKPTNLERVIPEVETGSSFTAKMHNLFPFTTAKVDFGWNLESGAVNTVEISGGLNVERRKTPTRMVLDIRAAYDYDKATATDPAK